MIWRYIHGPCCLLDMLSLFNLFILNRLNLTLRTSQSKSPFRSPIWTLTLGKEKTMARSGTPSGESLSADEGRILQQGAAEAHDRMSVPPIAQTTGDVRPQGYPVNSFLPPITIALTTMQATGRRFREPPLRLIPRDSKHTQLSNPDSNLLTLVPPQLHGRKSTTVAKSQFRVI